MFNDFADAGHRLKACLLMRVNADRMIQSPIGGAPPKDDESGHFWLNFEVEGYGAEVTHTVLRSDSHEWWS